MSVTMDAEEGSCRLPLLPLLLAPADEFAADELPLDLLLRLRWFGGLKWWDCTGVGVGGLGAGVFDDELVDDDEE